MSLVRPNSESHDEPSSAQFSARLVGLYSRRRAAETKRILRVIVNAVVVMPVTALHRDVAAVRQSSLSPAVSYR